MSNGTLIAREIEADEYEYKSSSQYQDRVELYGVVVPSMAAPFVVQGVTVHAAQQRHPARRRQLCRSQGAPRQMGS